MSETAFEYLSENKFATFCSNEAKWINKIRTLVAEHPEEAEIIYQPEHNQGYILAHVPKSWFKCSPPRKCNLTEEQRAAAAERLSRARNNR